MCELFAAVWIVGAMETRPGTMTIDYMTRLDENAIVRTVHIPTNEYLECWGNGYN